MAEAKIFRIFRYTNASDDILLPSPDPFLDKIDFNLTGLTDSKKTSVENAFVLSCERSKPEGLGINLTAEKPNGVTQPLQVIEEVWTIKGFISNMRGNGDDGVNDFLFLLDEWKDDIQATPNTHEGGRFGIQDFSNFTNRLFPIGTGPFTQGLIFSNYNPISNYNLNRVDFTLEFRKSRGLDV